MTRTMRRGRRATLLLITGLLTATDLSVAEGVRAANPRTDGWGSSQHSTPNSRDPNAPAADACASVTRREAPATFVETATGRPDSTRIIAPIRAVFGW
jgi:hypothetical protein